MFPAKWVTLLKPNPQLVLCHRLLSSKAYYDELGLTPAATQNDIKTAYYKLSMLYHPDKNKNSDSAAQKFRDITSAYEILGNFKLRRMYDKGMLPDNVASTPSPATTYNDTASMPEDDPQTKFYKARMQRNNVNATGRTQIYNFDEWSRAHYGSSFERSQKAKRKYESQEYVRTRDKDISQKELLLFGLLFCTVSIFYVSLSERRNDDISQFKDTKKSTSS